jgi:hypothetical protein
MAKKRKVPIGSFYGVAESPCIKTGKTDHVLDVTIGDYVYPLHITELWKEVENFKPEAEIKKPDKEGKDADSGKSGSNSAATQSSPK